MQRMPVFLCILLCLAGFVSPCPAAEPNVLNQYSTIYALSAGNYDGQLTIGELKKWGNLGLGTFNGLDGEMVVLDGVVYRVAYDGQVFVTGDDVKTPFAQVVEFSPDAVFPMENIQNMESLQKHLNIRIAGEEKIFHVFRVQGEFSSVTLRSVARQKQPFPPLAQAIKEQQVFQHDNIKGTLLGFRFPASCANVGPEGYHFHFISKDGKHGGHVLDAAVAKAEAAVDSLHTLRLKLP